MASNQDTKRLVLEYQGLVRSIAWKIHHRLPRWVELDDLIGYGNVGLAQAARDFDPTRNWQFTTYAFYRIRGAILDGLKQMHWFRPADYHRGHCRQLSQAVLEAHAPVPEAAARSLEEELAWFRNTCGRLAVVHLLKHTVGELAWAIDPQARPPDAIAEETDLHDKLWECVDELPKMVQKVVRAVYNEGITLKQAGERLGRDKFWASRVHAKAIAQLASRMRGLATRGS